MGVFGGGLLPVEPHPRHEQFLFLCVYKIKPYIYNCVKNAKSFNFLNTHCDWSTSNENPNFLGHAVDQYNSVRQGIGLQCSQTASKLRISITILMLNVF